MTRNKIAMVQHNVNTLFMFDGATKLMMTYVQKQSCVALLILCPTTSMIHFIWLNPYLAKSKNDS